MCSKLFGAQPLLLKSHCSAGTGDFGCKNSVVLTASNNYWKYIIVGIGCEGRGQQKKKQSLQKLNIYACFSSFF